MSKKVDFQKQVKIVRIVWLVLAAGLGSALVLLAKAKEVSLGLTHLTKDQLLSTPENLELGSAISLVYDVDIRWILLAGIIVSAVLALLALTKWKASVAKQSKKKSVWINWLDHGVVQVPVVVTLAILLGQFDIISIKLIAIFTALATYFGYLSEKENSTKKPVWRYFHMFWVASLIVWAALITAAITTVVKGSVGLPWQLWAALIAGALATLDISLNQMAYVKKRKQWKDFAFVERNQQVSSVILRLATVSFLIVGLSQAF
jgi:Heliorhodopsin